MSEFEVKNKKSQAINTLRSLCPRCQKQESHECPIARVISELNHLRAVPVNVNDSLHSVVFLK